MSKTVRLYDALDPPQGRRCPSYWRRRRRIVVPAVRQPSMLLGCLLGFTCFGLFAPYYLVGKIPELLDSWRWHVGSVVLSALIGILTAAVCMVVVFYSVLFGTSATWFDREGAHVFYLWKPNVLVPWETVLAEGSLRQENVHTTVSSSLPFVFVTVSDDPRIWLPGFARLGVRARARGPLMRRMRRVLRWADWAGYLEEAKRHLDDDPDTRKEERYTWYQSSSVASRRGRVRRPGRHAATRLGPEDDTP
ncbi:hypothetical protein [uncultured Actinomyces sp.]|uniref:hypothetical protein n=2 Tax=uncultured Actinomyces sp. TaxID=249061 RepID=UPI0028DC81D9|nr:hypothetical protein [uncultured Actinomyces sp.]